MRIDEVATNLRMEEPGFWSSPGSSVVSYPDEGNAWCFSVEDSSFWFGHRNNCILEAVKRFRPAGLMLDVGGGNGFVSSAIHNAGFSVGLVEPGRAGALNAKKRGVPLIINSSLENAGFKSHWIGAVP